MCKLKDLLDIRLYSTITRNACVGVSCPTRAFRITDTNMMVSKKPHGPNTNPNVSPNAWVTFALGSHWVRVGHVSSMLFFSFLPVLPNMGYKGNIENE